MNLKPATLAAAIGLAGSFGAHAAEKDIVDTAVEAGQFETLAAAKAALGKAGLVVERAHHEVGTAGQAEINWRFDELLNSADAVMKF